MLFLTLKVFSVTGGIEKVCRVAGKAIYEITQDSKEPFNVFSMYDDAEDGNNKYFPSGLFTGFNGNKLRFAYHSIIKGIKSKVVLLSHVNLLSVGILIKLFSPKTKLVLMAHGIEVWKSFPGWKRKMLNKTDLIICVSRFTLQKMKALHKVNEEKCVVLNNCLDPLLPASPAEKDKELLRRKYHFKETNFIVLTLSRLSTTEQNKNYDKILIALKHLSKYQVLYLFVGKYDDAEKNRLDKMIEELGITGLVTFTGYVPDQELAAYYGMADVYVMPSEKEGFGISFIEAMYYGLPVIAGNRDGSVDALRNGQLGILVDPRNQEEITGAIKKVIENKEAFIPDRDLLLKEFSYSTYKERLTNILARLKN